MHRSWEHGAMASGSLTPLHTSSLGDIQYVTRTLQWRHGYPGLLSNFDTPGDRQNLLGVVVLVIALIGLYSHARYLSNAEGIVIWPKRGNRPTMMKPRGGSNRQ